MIKRQDAVSTPIDSKIGLEFSVPALDLAKIITLQNKNLEAFAHANQLAIDSVEAVLMHQAEYLPDLLRQSLEEGTAVVRELAEKRDPQSAVLLQSKFAQLTFDRSVTNARLITDLLNKANSEALEILNTHFTSVLDDFKDSLSPTTPANFGIGSTPLSLVTSPAKVVGANK